MNFLTMDYFIAVAQERNITKAAQRLHITQQTLSAHIAALERELGTPLLFRTTPLRLTYAGEVFLRYAKEFQSGYTALRREFGDITDHQQGRLQVGISYTRGKILMPAILAAFQREYPRIQVFLREGSNEQLARWALEGDVDLSIAVFPAHIPGLELADFYCREIVLLIPEVLLDARFGAGRAEAEAKLTGGDLSPLDRFPLILGHPDDVNGRVGTELIREQGLRPDIRSQTENVETLLALCSQGLGAGFCPEDFLRDYPYREKGLELFRLGSSARFTVRFGYRRQPHQWSVISEFIRLARTTVPGKAR